MKRSGSGLTSRWVISGILKALLCSEARGHPVSVDSRARETMWDPQLPSVNMRREQEINLPCFKPLIFGGYLLLQLNLDFPDRYTYISVQQDLTCCLTLWPQLRPLTLLPRVHVQLIPPGGLYICCLLSLASSSLSSLNDKLLHWQPKYSFFREAFLGI